MTITESLVVDASTTAATANTARNDLTKVVLLEYKKLAEEQKRFVDAINAALVEG